MDNSITYNKLIRNIIIAVDYLLLWVMLMLYCKYGEHKVEIPGMFMVLGTVGLMIAEIIVPPMVHRHYLAVDHLTQRTFKFLLVFGISFFLLASVHRWTLGMIAPGKGIGMASVWVAVAITTARFIEFFAIRLGRAKGKNSRILTFIGDAEGILSMLNEIDCNAVKGLQLAGYYSESSDERLSARMKYRGDYSQLRVDLTTNKRMTDDIYCTLPASETTLINFLMTYSMEQVVRFYYVPAFMREIGCMLQPRTVGNQVVFTNFSEPLLSPSNRLLKRSFDVVVSLIVLIILLPLLPLIAILIKLQSPGPIFFRQKRTGMDGKDFLMYKFRSMHPNSLADTMQATKDDPRKFAFGSFMRKTNIDELPQFFNVLRGDMSIVGPRPHMLSHTEEYRHKIVEYMLRHYVRPGITGWAQTTGFRGETAELWQMEGRVKRDIWYIQNWTFWLDIRIILKTIWQTIHKDSNAY